MRQLNEQEMKTVLEKLMKFIGDNVCKLMDRTDHAYCFRLHSDRVYYARQDLVTWSMYVPRSKLVSVGTCIGKFTKTGKFKLLVTALPILAPYAQHKMWLRLGLSKLLTNTHGKMKSTNIKFQIQQSNQVHPYIENRNVPKITDRMIS